MASAASVDLPPQDIVCLLRFLSYFQVIAVLPRTVPTARVATDGPHGSCCHGPLLHFLSSLINSPRCLFFGFFHSFAVSSCSFIASVKTFLARMAQSRYLPTGLAVIAWNCFQVITSIPSVLISCITSGSVKILRSPSRFAELPVIACSSRLSIPQ